jgi:hypothetical protein
MHDLISSHLKKGATHHEKISERQASLHNVHKERARHLEDSGDPVGSRHHLLLAEHHAELSKTHAAHAEQCKKTAQVIDARFGASDAGAKVVTDADLLKHFAITD